MSVSGTPGLSAAAEGIGRLAQSRDREVDAPRHEVCREHPDHQRDHHCDGVERDGVEGGRLHHGDWQARGHRPSERRDLGIGGEHPVAFERDGFRGALRGGPAEHFAQALGRPGGDEALVPLRPRHALALRVEDGDHPVVGHTLALEDVDDHARVDDRRHDVAHLVLLPQRDAKAERPAARALHQVADHRQSGFRRHDDGLGVERRGHRRARRNVAVVEQVAGRVGEREVLPAGLGHERALRHVVEIGGRG
jgi:hypothetical protein